MFLAVGRKGVVSGNRVLTRDAVTSHGGHVAPAAVLEHFGVLAAFPVQLVLQVQLVLLLTHELLAVVRV